MTEETTQQGFEELVAYRKRVCPPGFSWNMVAPQNGTRPYLELNIGPGGLQRFEIPDEMLTLMFCWGTGAEM